MTPGSIAVYIDEEASTEFTVAMPWPAHREVALQFIGKLIEEFTEAGTIRIEFQPQENSNGVPK